MLTRNVILARLTGALAEPFTIANEKIYGVLRASLTVSHAILAKQARWLHKQLAHLGPLCGSLYCFRCGQLNHLHSLPKFASLTARQLLTIYTECGVYSILSI